MKTKLLFISLLLFGILGFSQEIKIKKGELLLDGKVVAKVEDKGRLYSFSNLDGKLQFTGKIVNSTTGPGSDSKNNIGWIEFTGANGKVREASFEDVPFTLSMGKMIVQNALVKGLITKGGIDESKVNDFFQAEDKSLSQALKSEKDLYISNDTKEDSIAQKYALDVDLKGNITVKGNKIGTIQKVSVDAQASEFSKGTLATMNKYYEYQVFDLNNTFVAKLPCSDNEMINNKHGLKIYTADGKVWPIRVRTNNSERTSLPMDNLAERMINKLFAEGYIKGNE